MNESIYMNTYFRQKAYQANMNKQLQEISTNIQLSANTSTITNEKYANWAKQYEKIGGDPENFKAYWSRQLTRADQTILEEFKKELEGDTTLGTLQRRMNAEYSVKPIWAY